jgi:uncharacterized protein involved in exopolysaccharide biosynthesis/Mrp family chromosome partitioning ATPase
MNAFPVTPRPPGLTLSDIYFTVFRHKRKIILCAALGIVAAVAMYKLDAPPYQSEAKLFVRYIISENKALGPTTNDATAKSPDQRGETIMKSEEEILGSLDIAKQVAEAIGAEKILAKAGGGNNLGTAVALVKNGLSIYLAPASSVITVNFRHPDPEIVQPVLREVIERYRKLHVETHTANGMLGDFLAQETDQLRSRLSQTEDELRRATAKAGIISIEDAKRAHSEQLTNNRRDQLNAQAELAERTAVLDDLTKRIPATPGATEVEPVIASDVLADYRSVSQQIEGLQRSEQDLLTQFTAGSSRVKEVHARLVTAVEARTALERDHPQLISTVLANRRGGEATGLDPAIVASQIIALQAKIKVLNTQLGEIRVEASKVDQLEGPIVELKRKKELEDANYRYYSASLEQSRINETLGDGRVSNISQIQAPSPPFSDRNRSNKAIGMILAGSLLGGIAWAFLIELYFDRSIKRAVDIERSLRVPLFLAIPAFGRKQLNGSARLLNGANGHGANGHDRSTLVANGKAHPLQLFHETLRDRLIAYFESVNLTHKPKLVAVTGLGRNGGVTTTATGLAQSLSETGGGNVLLVDMNVDQGVAQQFLKGQEVRGSDQLHDLRDHAHFPEKAAVATDQPSNYQLSRNMPQRFSRLVPKLKASDFDYIIFDMPPVTQVSITPRLAGFMDMVLLVVESEKSDTDLVQRAAALLTDSRTHVGVVLNKTRRYIPAGLDQDVLSSS